MEKATVITIQATINAPVEKVWQYYTEPEHITQWNHASDDWVCPRAENDLRTGGDFNFRMESVDGSQGFDMAGTYDEVRPLEYITYKFGDGRKIEVNFTGKGEQTEIVINFDAENENPIEMQRGGWQAILDNFKKHVENS